MVNFIANFVKNNTVNMIYIFAAVNFVILCIAFGAYKKNNKILHPEGNKRFKRSTETVIDAKETERLQKAKTGLLILYSCYANITAIFPLLGILGTVGSLTGMTDSEVMMDNFMIALSTTLLGVFFAIIYKLADPIISGPIEAFVDDADYVIREFDKKELADEA